MEGVMLVEMASGALHYTKSFSDAFDVRHPKTERLNLSALIFALQNFAGSSVRPPENAGHQTSFTTGIAEISMLATPLENIVLAATPSNKLLVVLFTAPDFDAAVARGLVKRVAYNYENGENAEMQLMTVLNQVPRRFRHAFFQAIDETIERELVNASEQVLLGLEESDFNRMRAFDHGELFVFFHYSARLDDSASIVNDQENYGGGEKETSANDREDEHRKAVPPTLGQIARQQTKNLSICNMMASTRAIAATTIQIDDRKKRKTRKKPRWRSKNAVVSHSDPQGFQRVIEIDIIGRVAALMEPHRTGRAYRVADVVLPFVELSGLTLFAPASTSFPKSQQLEQMVWENAPSSRKVVKGESGAGNNVMAWRRGRCLLFYPVLTSSSDPQSRTHLAVAQLFDVLEPLLTTRAVV